MHREQVKKLSKAVEHFSNGGELWEYRLDKDEWIKQTELIISEGCRPVNIIEDKFFKFRKALSLGKKIQCKSIICDSTWLDTSFPLWKNHYEYRVKPKEAIYEWQWILLTDGFISDKTLAYHTEYVNGWIKFEPSKRIRR